MGWGINWALEIGILNITLLELNLLALGTSPIKLLKNKPTFQLVIFMAVIGYWLGASVRRHTFHSVSV